MDIRPTQSSIFNLVRSGLASNLARILRGQEQISSGRKLLRPSDDPTGTALAMSLRGQIGDSERQSKAAQDARTLLDSAAAALEDSSGLASQARALLLQAMNGTLSDQDRKNIAAELEGLRAQLIDVANQKLAGQFLFGGTEVRRDPFREAYVGGQNAVLYEGNEDELRLAIGPNQFLSAGLSGSEVFAKEAPGATQYAGLTGVRRGLTPDQGQGYDYLEVRHESTSGVLGPGFAFVNAGAGDTIMGAHTLTVDGVAGTVQLDGGALYTLPSPTSPDAADFVVRNAAGAELHLDVTGASGASFTAAITGNGSVSVDGAAYTAIDFANADLELVDAATGAIVHVDTTGIHRSGMDLLTFGGTSNIFDVLQGAVDDLNNVHGLDAGALRDRLDDRLGELDRNLNNILTAVTVLGGRSAGASGVEERRLDGSVRLRELLSGVEDADFAEVVLQMTQAQQALQYTQAASARLLQNSLLNFLR